MFGVIHLRPITKLVAVLVGQFRFFVLQRNRFDVQGQQRVELASFRYPGVIRVLPQLQTSENAVSLVNYSVAISAIRGVRFRIWGFFRGCY